MRQTSYRPCRFRPDWHTRRWCRCWWRDAKAVEGPIRWEAASTLPYVPGGDDGDLEADDEDDAAAIPKCVVVDPGFDWEGDWLLGTPWHETVIYETHVKGFTKLLPAVRDDLRGTYAALTLAALLDESFAELHLRVREEGRE